MSLVAPPKTLLQRINHAWEPLKSSFAVHVFGLATFLELLGFFLDWEKKLDDAKLWPSWAPAVNVIVYVALGVAFLRAVFLLAERAGELEEYARGLAAELAASATRLKRCESDHYSLLESLHSLIHTTRDATLTSSSFACLLRIEADQEIPQMYRLIEAQIGMIQRGMRSLTDGDCNVCLKWLEPTALQGSPGLQTVCYGPAVPVERRENSLILSTIQGIAAEALVTKTIAVSQDILEDDRFWPRDRREYYGTIYRTVVASPIILNKVARGVLCFDWREPEKYLPEHRHAIACFTDLVTTACYIHEKAHILKRQPAADDNRSLSSGKPGILTS